MYGLVNKAIKDLVTTAAGEDAWRRVSSGAGLENGDFIEATSYDDEVTFSLVQAASEELGQPPEAILFEFGRHWILYTGREGWDSLFSLGGNSVKSFLTELDDMHARVQVAMPESRMPKFSVIEIPDGLEVQYRSHRAGLAPMVSGMLSGLAERFNEQWDITHTMDADKQGFDTFQLKQVQSSTGDGLIINAA